jgi:hypothetical protein
MEALEPRVSSFSVLAERVRKASSWPRAEKLKPSSLATYLGRLDKGSELEQFEKSPGILKALAEVLEMTLEDMNEQLDRFRAPRAQADFRFKLRDVPLRPVDLSREPLPPGIPERALSPEHWPVWWHAPSGSGRTLAGQWLAARGLATFIQAATWAEAERQLPEAGVVFIELGSAEGAPFQAHGAPGLRLCVASEAYPPEPPLTGSEPGTAAATTTTRRWPLLENPRVSTWLRALLNWLKERATGDGFDSTACLHWLNRSSGILSEDDNLDTAMGLIGLFATYTRKAGTPGPLTKASSLAELARLFLRMRQQQVEEADLSANVLWERLRMMSKRLLLDVQQPWSEARPLDDWHALATQRPDGADLDWLSELALHGLKVDTAALARARGKLPPDAFRTVRALRTLGLLREKHPRHFAIHPPWVLQGLLEQALRELIDEETPTTWGKVLLQQEWAVFVARHLLERGQRGDLAGIRALLAAPEPSSPTWVAAFEVSFRVLGLVTLEGVQVPDELRLAILRLQRKLLVPTYDGLPQPRLTHDYPSARKEFLLAASSWYAALLALAEPVPATEDVSLEAWYAKLTHEQVTWMPHMVTSFRLEDTSRLPEPWRMPLLRLGGRLMDRLGLQSPPPPRFPDILQPEYLLRLLQQDTPSLQDIDTAVYWGELGDALPDYAREHGLDWKQLARKVWSLWLAKDTLELPPFLWPKQDHAWLFWQALPVEAIRVLFGKGYWRFGNVDAVFSFFEETHWHAFVDVWIELCSRRESSWWSNPPCSAWSLIPPEHVRRALRAGLPDGLDHDTRRALWQRMPEVFCEEIDTLFKQERWDDALTQAWAVPPAYFPRVLASVESAVTREGTSPPPTSVARWLREQIGRRVPDWQRAWLLLEHLLPTVGRAEP